MADRKTSIDEGLDQALRLRQPGQLMELREIARICRCSYQRIEQIQKSALIKLRRAIGEEFREELWR